MKENKRFRKRSGADEEQRALLTAAAIPLIVIILMIIIVIADHGKAKETENQEPSTTIDRKSTRLNSSHALTSRMPSSA